VALVLSAGVLAFGGTATAIQTTTWGIQPAPHAGGLRAGLNYPSNGQTVHDAVIVYNRTASAEVIDLSVMTAAHVNGTYQYASKLTGLAAGVTLAGHQIDLGPHQQATVPVTVKLPRRSKVTALAAISAESAPVKQGSLLIQQQLVILVKATPSTGPAPVVANLTVWGPIAGALLAVVAGLLGLAARRRSRSRPGGDGNPQPVAPGRDGSPGESEPDLAVAR
jgi:hypothetical protein